MIRQNTEYNWTTSLLQAWFSPAFPVGAFSYSHGLESAIQQGFVDDDASLSHWIVHLLEFGSGWQDSLILKAAYQHTPNINELCLALCASKERERETLEMGRAFVRAVRHSHDLKLSNNLAYPVAIGEAASQLELDERLTIQSYLQAFAANLISVGIRIIPIGQQTGHNILMTLIPAIHRINAKVSGATLENLGSASFVADIMTMQHETASPRIYRT